MTDTIENPTADQLEAGGTVSGTVDDILRFEDQTLIGRSIDGRLELPNMQLIVDSDHRHGLRFSQRVTITSYTPPRSKPWWETCDDDTLIEVDWGGTRTTRSADAWREFYVRDMSERNPRRVLIADADTDLVVPRAAVDKLWESARPINGKCRSLHETVNLASAADAFLAAVDEVAP